MAHLEQLKQFYPFDDDVLNSVGEAAEWQNRYSFIQLAEHYDIADGPTVVPANQGRKAFEVLTLTPRQDYDPAYARVYHVPMAMPIDQNMTMRALRLFAADPSRQLVVAGNPSAAGQKYGKLRWRDMPQVWGGDLTPAVDPLLTHLRASGVNTTAELGFSYGADLAATSSARAEAHDIAVDQGAWMESVAAFNKGPGLVGLARLALEFTAAGNKLESYVRACHSRPLNDARQLADVGMPRYMLGLARPSNIAISNALAHGAFESRAAAALTAQQDLQTTLVWGTASEMTTDDSMTTVASHLQQAFGPERVKPLIIEGMHHAGGDHIDLHAAIVLQALAPGPR